MDFPKRPLDMFVNNIGRLRNQLLPFLLLCLTTVGVLTGKPLAYVANERSDTVSIIDTTTTPPSVVDTIAVGSLPGGIAFSPDGTRAYVANEGSGNVSVIDTTSSPPSILVSVAVGLGPFGLAVSPDGSLVYVPNNGSDSVSIIDTTTSPPSVIATVGLSGRPRVAAFTPDGSRAYVTAAGGTLAVFDTATHTIVAVRSLSEPVGVAFTPDGARAYVPQRTFAGTVAVLDTTTSPPGVVTTIPVGDFPQYAAMIPDGTKVYVTNLLSDTISVIDTSLNTVVSTIPVEDAPYWVAVTPDGSSAYVANRDSNSVSVIDTATDTTAFLVGGVVDGPRGLAIANVPTGCPDPVTIDYQGFTASDCGAPQNAVTVFTQAELDAYMADFGFDGSTVKNVKVNFNPSGEVVIVSPWEVKLNGLNNSLDVQADNVCVYGRRGVAVAEDAGNPDRGVTASVVALVSEEGNAGFSKGLELIADEILVQAAKEAKIGLDSKCYGQRDRRLDL